MSNPRPHTFGTDTSTRYYLMRDGEYLNWSGHHFTPDEECAWLGTSAHLEAFREHHPLSRADCVKIITAPDAAAGCKARLVTALPVHEEMEA